MVVGDCSVMVAGDSSVMVAGDSSAADPYAALDQQPARIPFLEQPFSILRAVNKQPFAHLPGYFCLGPQPGQANPSHLVSVAGAGL
jgi:hypothetical protein